MFGERYGGPPYGPYEWAHGGGPHPFAWVLFALLLIALAVLLAAAVRWAVRGRGAAGAVAVGGAPVDGALAELRLRYARGEIGRDEFLRVNEDLGGERADQPGAHPS